MHLAATRSVFWQWHRTVRERGWVWGRQPGAALVWGRYPGGGCGPGLVRDLHGGAATGGTPELAHSLAAPERRLLTPFGKINKVVGEVVFE